jgi:hypothetical protein
MPILGVVASSKLVAPAGDYESIASFSLGSNTSTVTFSGIPSTYSHLQLRSSVTQTVEGNVRWRVGNGTVDTGSNYYQQVIISYQSSVNGGGMGGADNFPVIWVAGNTYPAVGIIDLWEYSNANKRKTISIRNGHATNGTGATRLWYWNQFWNDTNTINIISITSEGGSFITGSQFALYGIKG